MKGLVYETSVLDPEEVRIRNTLMMDYSTFLTIGVCQ